MELVIKYSGRKIGFIFEGAETVQNEPLGLSEYKVREIRASGGPKLKVIASKVAAILKGHVWPKSTSVWVEQHGKRVLATAA